MNKKKIIFSAVVGLLILSSIQIISFTVKSDDPPNVYAKKIFCDSDPIEEEQIEWFYAEIANEEDYAVNITVIWRLDEGYEEEENLTVPDNTGDFLTNNASILWPEDNQNHVVKIEIWWNGTMIDSLTKGYCVPHVSFSYFDNYEIGEAAEVWTTNPGYMADGMTSNYASTSTNGDVEALNDNSNSQSAGTISSVWIRAKGYYSGTKHTIILTPVFGGTVDGDQHEFDTISTSSAWSPWFEITDDPGAPETWTWNDVDNLDCDVVADDSSMGAFTLYCSQVELRVFYT